MTFQFGGRNSMKGAFTARDKSGFFPPGFKGQVLIHNVQVITRVGKNEGDPAFIAELEVVSKDAESVDLPAGSRRSWFVNMTSKYCWSDLKTFTAAATGISLNDAEGMAALEADSKGGKGCVADDLFMSAIDPKGGSPWAGVIVRLVTKSNEMGTFTKHYWSAVEAK